MPPLKSGLTLYDIDLGQVDAEADKRLSDYFVTTPYVGSALSLARSHFLGRKGSGKSSLFTQLDRLFHENAKSSVGVIKLTPDQYAWSALRQYREQGLLPEQAHTNAWKFTIAIEVAGALASADYDGLPPVALAAQERLGRFIKQNFGDAVPSMSSTATSLLKGIRSFNLQAFGFGVGVDREDHEQPLTPLVIASLLDSIDEVVKHRGVVVALDKLDDSWDGSEDSKNLLIGLLKATKDINDRYSSGRPESGLAVLCFLRTDIYEGLRFDDKDKHRSVEEHIMWDSRLLEEMVDKRLPDGIGAGDLFEKGKMRGKSLPFTYIVKRTFLRPREVLQFLQECIRVAGRDAHAISKEHIREAEERYSSWKVEDLKQEYRRAQPHFESLLESLRQGEHRYDSLDAFEAHLERSAPEVVNVLGKRRSIELLFDASVVGVRLGGSGSARFRCEDSTLVLPTSGAVYVHQSLYRGLNIHEKRTRK